MNVRVYEILKVTNNGVRSLKSEQRMLKIIIRHRQSETACTILIRYFLNLHHTQTQTVIHMYILKTKHLHYLNTAKHFHFSCPTHTKTRRCRENNN